MNHQKRHSSFITFTFLLIFTLALVVGFHLCQPQWHLLQAQQVENGTDKYQLPSADSVPSDVFPESVPLPVRKSVTKLTSAEKAAFVNALNTLKQTVPEGSEISIYDQLVLAHVLVMGCEVEFGGSGVAHGANHAHGLSAFLPWHRQLVRQLERALQEIDPSVTVPYWDWTEADALDVMLAEDFLGTNGQGETIELPSGTFTGGVVTNGVAANWTLNEDINIEPINYATLGSKLTRYVGLPPLDRYPIPKEAIAELMAQDTYDIFNALLEGDVSLDSQGQMQEDRQFHSYMHGLIGGALFDGVNITPLPRRQTKILGTMGNLLSSPYDPVFYLNHANVDRLWAEWQDQGHTGEQFYPAAGKPVGHNLNDSMWPWDGGRSHPGNLSDADIVSLLSIPTDNIVRPVDVLDFRKLGYTYDTTQREVQARTLASQQANVE